MAQHVTTRTIHTVTIDVQDDVLSRIEMGDEIEIVLASRNGVTRPMKLNYGNVRDLTEGRPIR